MKKSTLTHAALAGLLLVNGCHEGPLASPLQNETRLEASSIAMANSRADFPSWVQGFNLDAGGWIGAATPGPAGWCGGIEAVSRDDSGLVPSAGNGYALVTHTPCNDYWSSHGFPGGSGPYSPGAGYSTAFPEGGFVTELDIHLDPTWASASPFSYAASFTLLDQAYPDNFRYLLVPVSSDGRSLTVDGEEVTEAGWYTFRHRFMDDGGELAVRFELLRHGETLFSKAVNSTSFTGESLESFDAENVGTGYLWFVHIAPGMELAIDEHRVRRGS